jgi:hypothetical protein
MSNPKPAPGKEPAALQSTRQMLDELDALMDRMLALPVNELDEAMAPPREMIRMPTVSATLTVLESPGASRLAPAAETPPMRELVRFPSYSTVPAPSWPDAPETGQVENLSYGENIPTRIPQPGAVEEVPPSIMDLPVPVTEPIPEVKLIRLPTRSLLKRLHLPILWFNRGFDKMTILLGPSGRWLRGQRGRHAMGLAGLGLLGLAGLWVLKDLLGWIW